MSGNRDYPQGLEPKTDSTHQSTHCSRKLLVRQPPGRPGSRLGTLLGWTAKEISSVLEGGMTLTLKPVLDL